MSPYTIKYTPRADRDLSRLSPEIAKKVVRSIHEIGGSPYLSIKKMRSEEETIELLRTISTGETPRNSALKIFTERLHSRFSICFHSASVRASTKSSCRLSHDMGCRPVLPVFFKRFNDEVGHHLVTKRVEVSVVG